MTDTPASESQVPDGQSPQAAPGPAETVQASEIVDPGEDQSVVDTPRGAVSEPAKVMRIGAMIKQLLEEVRATDLDEGGRNRLREIYDTSIAQLSEALSPDLQEELASLTTPFGDDDVPSESELQIAQAQLVGWLEGLFHGIQATLFAQQMAAQQQLEQIKQAQQLPAGGQPPQPGGGTYL